MRNRQLSEKDCIDHTEDRGVRADAQPQRQNGNKSKPWVFAQCSKSVIQILGQCINEPKSPNGPTLFQQPSLISEFTKSRLPRLNRILTGIDSFRNFHFQMMVHLFS